jgi:ferrous iron transport protein B
MTDRAIRVAIIGNPNCGKTCLFNNLTGARQHVGNWPGVTVECKTGDFRHAGRAYDVLDLPGTYSMSAYSLEEDVVERCLTHEPPDIIINIVDSSNLERHLFLTAQLVELGVPMILVLNMMDEAAQHGLQINVRALGELLGLPVVPMVARRNQGTRELLAALEQQARAPHGSQVRIDYGGETDAVLQRIIAALPDTNLAVAARMRAVLLLLRRPVCEADRAVLSFAQAQRAMLERHVRDSMDNYIAGRWYGFANGCVRSCVTQGALARFDLTEKLDNYLTHPVLGLLIFGACMWLVFELVFALSGPCTTVIELALAQLSALATRALPAGLLQQLVVDGIIAGVGGVIMFLPNIVLLFLAIGFLEDSGYMARAAFVMDGIMHRLGLHGKSFIPMLVGFGCTVPAIMATRMLDSKRDRILTALIVPFMSCSARLPVYALFIGAFFTPAWQATVLLSIYLLGILVAILAANILGRLLYRKDFTPLLMELPPYRLPTGRSVLLLMWMRAWMYLRKAGTLLLCVALLMWWLCTFPRSVQPDGTMETRIDHTYAGRFGHALAPVLRPLGFDWRIGVGLVSGLMAKEAMVSTLMIVYGVNAADEHRTTALLQERLRGDAAFAHRHGPLTAYTVMVFVLLYVPCLATVVVFWREFKPGWTLFMVGYTTGTAWLVAWLVRQLGLLLGW